MSALLTYVLALHTSNAFLGLDGEWRALPASLHHQARLAATSSSGIYLELTESLGLIPLLSLTLGRVASGAECIH